MLLIIELVILIVVSLTISICSFLQKGPLISLIYYTSNKEERIRLKTKKRYYFIGSIFLVASILFGIILAEKIFNLPSMQKPLILISIILSTYFVIRYSQLELERMKNKEYKKTYKPLVAWLVIYPLVNIIIIMAIDRLFQLPKKMSVKASVLFSLIFMVFSLYILMFIIYKGEYVYWINGGPSFKEA